MEKMLSFRMIVVKVSAWVGEGGRRREGNQVVEGILVLDNSNTARGRERGGVLAKPLVSRTPLTPVMAN